MDERSSVTGIPDDGIIERQYEVKCLTKDTNITQFHSTSLQSSVVPVPPPCDSSKPTAGFVASRIVNFEVLLAEG